MSPCSRGPGPGQSTGNHLRALWAKGDPLLKLAAQIKFAVKARGPPWDHRTLSQCFPAAEHNKLLLPPSPGDPPATAARPGPLIWSGPAAQEATGPRSSLRRPASCIALARHGSVRTLQALITWAAAWPSSRWSMQSHLSDHAESKRAAVSPPVTRGCGISMQDSLPACELGVKHS